MSSGLTEVIRLRADRDLRSAVAAAAREQRISASELIRRRLRQGLVNASPEARHA